MNNKENNSKAEEECFVFATKNLPDCFDNRDLLTKIDLICEDYKNANNIIEDNFEIINDKVKSLKCLKNNIFNTRKGSEPINYTMSKPDGGIRIMSVVNPLFLIPLHKYILEKKDNILFEQEDPDNNFDASSHFYYQDGGFLVEKQYDDYVLTFYKGHYYQKDYTSNMISKLKISNGKFYSLKIDISSFYNSIYTHTISWYCKNRNSTTIMENLDVLNRTLNSNETKGLAIGPYTSTLFSEILLSKVDRAIKEKLVSENVFYQRYSDDYTIYSDSREKLHNIILPLIENELAKYKLDINYSKVSIDEFPFFSEEKDLNRIIEDIKNILTDDKEEILKVNYITTELGQLIKRKYSETNYILSFLISSKNLIFKDSDSIKVLLNCLINIMFKNDLTAKRVVTLILKISKENQFCLREMTEEWIIRRNNLSNSIKNVIDIWLLYIILESNISNDMINKYVINVLGTNQLSDILIFEYLYKNELIETYKNEVKKYLEIIEEDFERRYEGQLKDCYFTKYWLLFYTNSIRWKIHEIKGFKISLFKECSLSNIINKYHLETELNLFNKMYNNNVNLFNL